MNQVIHEAMRNVDELTDFRLMCFLDLTLGVSMIGSRVFIREAKRRELLEESHA